ncbi:MAG: hypothetical protein AB8B83_06225 [Bdellovibrionales bacterium]
MAYGSLSFSDQVRLIQMVVDVPVTGQTSNTNAVAMTSLTGLSGNQMWQMSTGQFLDHVHNRMQSDPSFRAQVERNIGDITDPSQRRILATFTGGSAPAMAAAGPTVSNPGVVQALAPGAAAVAAPVQAPPVQPAQQPAAVVAPDPVVTADPVVVEADPELRYRQGLLAVTGAEGVTLEDVTGTANANTGAHDGIPTAMLEQITSEAATRPGLDQLLLDLGDQQTGGLVGVLQALLRALGFDVAVTGVRDERTNVAVEGAQDLLGKRDSILAETLGMEADGIFAVPSGSGIAVNVGGTPILDEDGNITGVEGGSVMTFDREAIMASNGTLAGLIQTSPEALAELTEAEQATLIERLGIDPETITIPEPRVPGEDEPGAEGETPVVTESGLGLNATTAGVIGGGLLAGYLGGKTIVGGLRRVGNSFSERFTAFRERRAVTSAFEEGRQARAAAVEEERTAIREQAERERAERETDVERERAERQAEADRVEADRVAAAEAEAATRETEAEARRAGAEQEGRQEALSHAETERDRIYAETDGAQRSRYETLFGVSDARAQIIAEAEARRAGADAAVERAGVRDTPDGPLRDPTPTELAAIEARRDARIQAGIDTASRPGTIRQAVDARSPTMRDGSTTRVAALGLDATTPGIASAEEVRIAAEAVDAGNTRIGDIEADIDAADTAARDAEAAATAEAEAERARIEAEADARAAEAEAEAEARAAAAEEDLDTRAAAAEAEAEAERDRLAQAGPDADPDADPNASPDGGGPDADADTRSRTRRALTNPWVIAGAVGLTAYLWPREGRTEEILGDLGQISPEAAALANSGDYEAAAGHLLELYGEGGGYFETGSGDLWTRLENASPEQTRAILASMAAEYAGDMEAADRYFTDAGLGEVALVGPDAMMAVTNGEYLSAAGLYHAENFGLDNVYHAWDSEGDASLGRNLWLSARTGAAAIFDTIVIQGARYGSAFVAEYAGADVSTMEEIRRDVQTQGGLIATSNFVHTFFNGADGGSFQAFQSSMGDFLTRFDGDFSNALPLLAPDLRYAASPESLAALVESHQRWVAAEEAYTTLNLQVAPWYAVHDDGVDHDKLDALRLAAAEAQQTYELQFGVLENSGDLSYMIAFMADPEGYQPTPYIEGDSEIPTNSLLISRLGMRSGLDGMDVLGDYQVELQAILRDSERGPELLSMMSEDMLLQVVRATVEADRDDVDPAVVALLAETRHIISEASNLPGPGSNAASMMAEERVTQLIRANSAMLQGHVTGFFVNLDIPQTYDTFPGFTSGMTEFMSSYDGDFSNAPPIRDVTRLNSSFSDLVLIHQRYTVAQAEFQALAELDNVDIDQFLDLRLAAAEAGQAYQTAYRAMGDDFLPEVIAFMSDPEGYERTPGLDLDIPPTESLVEEFIARTGEAYPSPTEGGFEVAQTDPGAYSIVAYSVADIEGGAWPLEISAGQLSIGDSAMLHNREAVEGSTLLSGAIRDAVMALPASERGPFLEAALGFYNGPDAAGTFSTADILEGIGQEVTETPASLQGIADFYAATLTDIQAELNAGLIASVDLPDVVAFSAHDVERNGNPPVHPVAADADGAADAVAAYEAAWQDNPSEMTSLIAELISGIVSALTGQDGFENYRTAVNDYYADTARAGTRPPGEAEAVQGAVEAAGRDAGYILDADIPVASATTPATNLTRPG